MIRPREHHREVQYRPQAMKTLHHSLFRFIRREFPRLGGPWVVNIFVDKLLELVDQYRFFQGRLTPGQVVWPAVVVDETPGYRKPISRTRQVPVVVTLVNQDDISYLRNNGKRSPLLKRCIVRAANDAYAQGGVLSCTDLGVLFQRSNNRVAEIIREYEAETGQCVPRRGTIHDMGRTFSHKKIICQKAYLEGKVTPQIAQETFHSPEAVDNYILDFARVYFAAFQRGMSVEETAFAIQRPRYLVEEYIKLIDAFGLTDQTVHQRVGVHLVIHDDIIEPSPLENLCSNERREQEPIAG